MYKEIYLPPQKKNQKTKKTPKQTEKILLKINSGHYFSFVNIALKLAQF